MTETKISCDNVASEKIKAFEPHIIVNNDAVNPYYSIMYYDIADKVWHIGFGSYALNYVIKWLQEEFEEVEADFMEVVRCPECIYCENMKCTELKDNAGHSLDVAIFDYCSQGVRKERSDA